MDFRINRSVGLGSTRPNVIPNTGALVFSNANCPRQPLTIAEIAAIAFAAVDFGLGVLAAVSRQRASNLTLRFGELAFLRPYAARPECGMASAMRLDLSAAWLVPEKQEPDDEGDGNPE